MRGNIVRRLIIAAAASLAFASGQAALADSITTEAATLIVGLCAKSDSDGKLSETAQSDIAYALKKTGIGGAGSIDAGVAKTRAKVLVDGITGGLAGLSGGEADAAKACTKPYLDRLQTAVSSGKSDLPAFDKDENFITKIDVAEYGDLQGGTTCKIDQPVRNICLGKQECRLTSSNDLCGDPAPGKKKGIKVSMMCSKNGKAKSFTADEGATFVAGCK